MMTREELIEEAKEQVNYCTPYHPESFVQGYIAGTEPREKQIAELKKTIERYRKEREFFISEVENDD